MKFSIFDTNILVSALLSSHEDAATVQVLKTMFNGGIIPVYSEEILAEYNEVLRRKKFRFSENLIVGLQETIVKFGVSVIPVERKNFRKTDENAGKKSLILNYQIYYVCSIEKDWQDIRKILWSVHKYLDKRKGEKKSYSETLICDAHSEQAKFQETEYFKEKAKERYKIEAKNSELKHRHGYDVALSSALICMERQGAMTIFAVNLKRIIKLMNA